MEEQIEDKFSVTPYCEACGGDMHIEKIEDTDYYVCDDPGCMWMKKVVSD